MNLPRPTPGYLTQYVNESYLKINAIPDPFHRLCLSTWLSKAPSKENGAEGNIMRAPAQPVSETFPFPRWFELVTIALVWLNRLNFHFSRQLL